jgi:DNA-binding transcriptional LysR family regulator
MGLRVAFAPGVTPSKWFRIWSERLPGTPLEPLPLDSLVTATPDALALLTGDAADVALVRLPVSGDGLRSIPLYTELPVVVVPDEHVAAAAEELTLAELAELTRADEQSGTPALSRLEVAEGATGGADAVELVAAGVGWLVLPKSVARLHARRDVAVRDLVGDGVEAFEQRVALVWLASAEDDAERWPLIDEFIGVVRGRTANSTRGSDTVEAIEAAKKLKPTAVAKARAAEARAAKAAASGGKAKAKGTPAKQPGRTRPTGKGRRSR